MVERTLRSIEVYMRVFVMLDLSEGKRFFHYTLSIMQKKANRKFIGSNKEMTFYTIVLHNISIESSEVF